MFSLDPMVLKLDHIKKREPPECVGKATWRIPKGHALNLFHGGI